MSEMSPEVRAIMDADWAAGYLCVFAEDGGVNLFTVLGAEMKPAQQLDLAAAIVAEHQAHRNYAALLRVARSMFNHLSHSPECPYSIGNGKECECLTYADVLRACGENV